MMNNNIDIVHPLFGDMKNDNDIVHIIGNMMNNDNDIVHSIGDMKNDNDIVHIIGNMMNNDNDIVHIIGDMKNDNDIVHIIGNMMNNNIDIVHIIGDMKNDNDIVHIIGNMMNNDNDIVQIIGDMNNDNDIVHSIGDIMNNNIDINDNDIVHIIGDMNNDNDIVHIIGDIMKNDNDIVYIIGDTVNNDNDIVHIIGDMNNDNDIVHIIGDIMKNDNDIVHIIGDIILIVVDLLNGGAILNKPFQPFEAHIPYLLQVFIDYNLYGMNLINLAAVKFRRPKQEGETSNQVYSQGSHSNTSVMTPTTQTTMNSSVCSNLSIVSHQYWDAENIPRSQLLDADIVSQSVCEMEVDAVAADVTNRSEILSNIGTNPGLASIWEDEKQRRREKGESSQIPTPLSPDREDFPLTETEEMYQERLREVIQGYETLLESQIENEDSFNLSQDTIISHGESLPVSPLGGAMTRTPSSVVELHCSQFEGKDIPTDDGESEDEAVIDEDAVNSILETSQSFRDSPIPASQILADTQDRQLAKILAQLADESGLEDDSILSGTSQSQKLESSQSTPQNLQQKEENERELEESILMSQIWDDPDEDEVLSKQQEDSVDDDGDYVIPQVDGGADDKTESETSNPKKICGLEKTNMRTAEDGTEQCDTNKCENKVVMDNNLDGFSEIDTTAQKTFLNLDNINLANLQEDSVVISPSKVKSTTSCQKSKKRYSHLSGNVTPRKKSVSKTILSTPPKDDTLSLESMLTNVRRSASKISMTIPSIDLEPVVLGSKPPMCKNTKQQSLRMEQKRAKLSRRRQLVSDFPCERMQLLCPEDSNLPISVTLPVTQENSIFSNQSVPINIGDGNIPCTDKALPVVDQNQPKNDDVSIDDIPVKVVTRRSSRRSKQSLMRRRLSLSSDSSMSESNWNRRSDEDYREDEEDAEDDDFVIETKTLRSRKKTKPKKQGTDCTSRPYTLRTKRTRSSTEVDVSLKYPADNMSVTSCKSEKSEKSVRSEKSTRSDKSGKSEKSESSDVCTPPRKRKKGEAIPGIHYIIVNKFKGYKTMRVLVNRVKPISSVKVTKKMLQEIKEGFEKEKIRVRPSLPNKEVTIHQIKKRRTNSQGSGQTKQGKEKGKDIERKETDDTDGGDDDDVGLEKTSIPEGDEEGVFPRRQKPIYVRQYSGKFPEAKMQADLVFFDRYEFDKNSDGSQGEEGIQEKEGNLRKENSDAATENENQKRTRKLRTCTRRKSSKSSETKHRRRSLRPNDSHFEPMFDEEHDDSNTILMDTMWTLSYYSPHNSDSGEMSPPRCWSPAAKDRIKGSRGRGKSNRGRSKSPKSPRRKGSSPRSCEDEDTNALLSDLHEVLYNAEGLDVRVDKESMIKEIENFEKIPEDAFEETISHSIGKIDYIDSIIRDCSSANSVESSSSVAKNKKVKGKGKVKKGKGKSKGKSSAGQGCPKMCTTPPVTTASGGNTEYTQASSVGAPIQVNPLSAVGQSTSQMPSRSSGVQNQPPPPYQAPRPPFSGFSENQSYSQRNQYPQSTFMGPNTSTNTYQTSYPNNYQQQQSSTFPQQGYSRDRPGPLRMPSQQSNQVQYDLMSPPYMESDPNTSYSSQGNFSEFRNNQYSQDRMHLAPTTPTPMVGQPSPSYNQVTSGVNKYGLSNQDSFNNYNYMGGQQQPQQGYMPNNPNYHRSRSYSHEEMKNTSVPGNGYTQSSLTQYGSLSASRTASRSMSEPYNQTNMTQYGNSYPTSAQGDPHHVSPVPADFYKGSDSQQHSGQITDDDHMRSKEMGSEKKKLNATDVGSQFSKASVQSNISGESGKRCISGICDKDMWDEHDCSLTPAQRNQDNRSPSLSVTDSQKSENSISCITAKMKDSKSSENKGLQKKLVSIKDWCIKMDSPSGLNKSTDSSTGSLKSLEDMDVDQRCEEKLSLILHTDSEISEDSPEMMRSRNKSENVMEIEKAPSLVLDKNPMTNGELQTQLPGTLPFNVTSVQEPTSPTQPDQDYDSMSLQPGQKSNSSVSSSKINKFVSVNSSQRGGDLDVGGAPPSQLSSSQLLSCQNSMKIWTPADNPPTTDHVKKSLQEYDLPTVRHKKAYFSDPRDLPEKSSEVGGRQTKLHSVLPMELPEFESKLSHKGLGNWKTVIATTEAMIHGTQYVSASDNIIEEIEKNPHLKAAYMGNQIAVLTPAKAPPPKVKVQAWLQEKITNKLKLNQKSQKDNQEDKIELVYEENNDENVEDNKILDKTPCEVDQSSKLCQSFESESDSEEEDTSVDVISPSPEAKKRRSSLFLFSRYQQSLQDPNSNATPVKSAFHDVTARKRKSEQSPITVSQEHASTPTGLSRAILGDASSFSGPQHSTPTRLSRPMQLTLPSCTPIHSLREGESEGQPLKAKLWEKKSSGTKNLRRALLSSQLKHQLVTPVNRQLSDVSQIDGATPNNTCGFKVSMQNLQDAKSVQEVQHLTTMIMELQIRTRRDFHPDPEMDPIQAIFYQIHSDFPAASGMKADITGVIVVDPSLANQKAADSDPSPSIVTPCCQGQRSLLNRSGVNDLEVDYVTAEKTIFIELLKLVRKWDPDILVGYEIQMLSWGFLLKRAAIFDNDFCPKLSRIPDCKRDSHFSSGRDEYRANHLSEIHIAGRIVINLWRLMRHEVTLNIYNYENVAFHVLHQRHPRYSFRTLSDWFDHKTDLYRWRTVEYYTLRVRGQLQILSQLDLIGRTSELARLFGIEFYHVLSRGSQYRVESMMLRIAKPMNYIAASPSVQQRARSKAPECIPLNMEPESSFYCDPVLVLDFQSLYPTMMIAYNYCFSTCLGRVKYIEEGGEIPLGCLSLNSSPGLIRKLQKKDGIHVSPNGVAFIKRNVRKGVLPSINELTHSQGLERLLNARQLGLKLIANVTYGYTSANFSGRMPLIEIGDSVVRKGRETLERAIQLVENTPKWGAKVVYGDTDSMFVLLKGRSKDEAFKIGHEIAAKVTADNPKPVKLKFEKVYLPCVLQTKKRYVGYSYETEDQKEPVFDAKGIETVRRDACQAVAKILERSLKLLFNTKDVSQVKKFVQHQFQKISEGRVGMQDLIFAKEYRGMAGYRPGACVPALEISKRLLSVDRCAEPRVGERVPYVIVYGSPGLPLIQLVRRPVEVLQDSNLRLNATYYISKQILPPLNRVFSMMGIDVNTWYSELPKVMKVPSFSGQTSLRKGTISQYFNAMNCPVCGELTQQLLCSTCQTDPQRVTVVLNTKIHEWDQNYYNLSKICYNCCGSNDPTLVCVSMDCPVLFKISKANRDILKSENLRELQTSMLEF
uniref:DNA polymerase zeta catalytic subunit n=1 Tax=Saccoglossus kowalevskii TaxID=10224 RepID=A0ABM0LUZ7_SACKO|nr:PREDICTED: DNA polymerase zeta catalytic subunit-like [Saccoglossus kowalevskii]